MGVVHGLRKIKEKCGPDMSAELVIELETSEHLLCQEGFLLQTRIRTFLFCWHMKTNKTQGNGNVGKLSILKKKIQLTVKSSS